MTRMDDPDITFDESGLCNHCRKFDAAWVDIPKTEEESRALLDPVIAAIKKAGEGKTYDCIVGVSGGVDSTYVALLAKRLGLRPLAVHFDNGWNSELAVINIENTVSKLDIDLLTYVIDWEDFRELQIAYLKASVVDIEALTDHAIFGALYEIAIQHKIPYILSGVNIATEVVLPESWNYDKLDFVNIKDIYRKFGSGKRLSNYPFTDYKQLKKIRASGIKVVNILDMILYDINAVRAEITKELGWREYSGKHFESIFTRFYQGYLLPRKFGIDKRKAHLSNLICCGAMTREEALREYQQDNYPPEMQAADLEFVLKKLQLSAAEFEAYMKAPPRRHREFDNYRLFFWRYPIFSPLRPVWNWIKQRRAATA